jgi:hypothetical protein
MMGLQVPHSHFSRPHTCRAQRQGFSQVFVYDPAGIWQRHAAALERELGRSNDLKGMRVWSGWRPPPSQQQQQRRQQPGQPSSMSGTAGSGRSSSALKRRHKVDEEDGGERTSAPGGDTQFDVALLCAADSERPVSLAVAGPPMSLVAAGMQGGEGPLGAQGGAADAGSGGGASRLERAISAPATLRSWLQHASGRLAALEPDMVLVFGAAFTLAGYPPWAVRVSQIYHMGPLASVTSSKLDAVMRKFSMTKQRFGR